MCFFPSHLKWVMSLFCNAEYSCNWLKWFLSLWVNWGFRAAAQGLFNCLFKKAKKTFMISVYCWILTSASGLWHAADCWGLIGWACNRTQQCYEDLYCSLNFFSGISSNQLPPPIHSIHSVALNHPPSVWRACQTLWHMKTMVLACLRRHNWLLRQLFSPTEAQLTVRQTDFHLLHVEKWPCPVK